MGLNHKGNSPFCAQCVVIGMFVGVFNYFIFLLFRLIGDFKIISKKVYFNRKVYINRLLIKIILTGGVNKWIKKK